MQIFHLIIGNGFKKKNIYIIIMHKYTSLSKLVAKTDSNSKLTSEQANLLIEEEIHIDGLQSLYQVSGIKDENKAFLLHTGYAEKCPKIILKEFEFKGYEIKIISYVLSKYDLEESRHTGLLKMVGLLMCKKNIPLLSISIEYNISGEEKENLIDLISDKNTKKEINGNFVVLLRKKDDNKIINLHTFESYPGNNNLIEKLHKFLMHKELIYIYN